MRQAAPEDADKTILALALEHQLVTRLTSLIAVDKTPSRPAGERLKLAELPINLPAGWDFDTLFGGESGKAAMRNTDTLAARAAEQATGLDLPQTATGFVGTIAQGLALLFFGLGGLFLVRRRKDVA